MVVVMLQKREPPQQVEGRGAEEKEEQVGTFRTREGDEEERGRERSLPPPHLEKCPNARVSVGTKSAGPDTVYVCGCPAV